ncbi:hypothetical protein ATE72_11290 [Sphingopyxis sp. HXXIV]|nr:hypothetical protein ATE72_11290 [Sphingopyxis sp. HXXIV]
MQLPSSEQSWRPSATQAVSAIGPSTASMMSATLIAAAGRASLMPPPLPREATSRPARARLLTSFCAVGPGMPVCSASMPALSATNPHWRAAALISTTA